MIINDKFVFIHNPRTGGAFIRNIFKRSFPESQFAELHNFHIPISQLDKCHNTKLKFGVVRNPWAWYVSLYHFQQPNGKWLRLCSQGGKLTFKQFLTTFLSLEFANKNKHRKFYPVGNPYAPKIVPVFEYISSLDIGFFTYRYLYMFFSNYKEIFDKRVNVFDNHNNLLSLSMDNILKTEELPNNIIKLFEHQDIAISTQDKQFWNTQPKRNYTQHKSYYDYYDKELIELVNYKDRLVIEQYSYKFS